MRALIADCPALRAAASALITAQYLAAGFGQHEIPTGEHSQTLVVLDQAEVIGTLTLTFDNPAGLLADLAYREFLHDRREVGGRCAEITKFAFSTSSYPARDALFRLASSILTERGQTDLFIEVHPDHVRFYRRWLRFWTVGEVTITARVNAPARLLWIDLRLFKISVDRRGRPRAGVVDRRQADMLPTAV
ncbi:MAG: N-acyl amino acid synthase FeeM domain-containing protein [Janthinobacterium lividum]